MVQVTQVMSRGQDSCMCSCKQLQVPQQRPCPPSSTPSAPRARPTLHTRLALSQSHSSALPLSSTTAMQLPRPMSSQRTPSASFLSPLLAHVVCEAHGDDAQAVPFF